MARRPNPAAAANRRVAFVAPSARSLVTLRAGLIGAIVSARHKVLCLAPDMDAAAATLLKEMGADSGEFPLNDGSWQPLGDRRSIDAIATRLKDWQANVAISYGLKPMLLGALAARRAGAERVVMLASAPGWLAEPGARQGLGLRWLMRSAFKASDVVVFHNEGHAARIGEMGLIPATAETHVLPGGGVDLARFPAEPLPPLAPGLVLVMIAARERSKGVPEFLEAAARVSAKAPGTRFVLAGPPGTGRELVPADALEPYKGVVEVLGWQDDVRPLLAAAHVVVLPSYHEGMPRIVLEALATGRPCITTLTDGCRETVDERVNGVLVPAGDVGQLAAAMESFLRRPDLIPWMSRQSRLKAERRFDANAVHDRWLAILGLGRP